MTKLKDKFYRTNRHLLRLFAFLFPFLIVVTAFTILQVYPMGERCMLTVDCYHQYSPLLTEFREKLLDGKSIFYSWNTGLGSEFYAAYANYCASPLNLFVVFFSNKAVPVFVALITAVRAGLASLFMTMFLSENDSKRIDFVTIVFAASYALCGWFITDFWNIMWCDALVLLPLIALGLRKLMLEGKYALYVISLAICVYSNYYAGYFICLFMVFFSVVYYFALHHVTKDKLDPRRLCFKSFAICAGRFALGSVIAGAMTAVLSLPTYMILQNCSATGDSLEVNVTLTGNLFDFIGRFMVAANPNIRDGMANVYTGIVAVLLLPLFFMAPKKSGITLRHKIGFGFLMLMLYLSFSNRMLNFIWHGFHFPNQIPYRQSFLMSFVLICIAFMTIRVIRQFSLSAVCACAVGAGCYLILYEKFGEGNEGYIQILLTLVFILIQGLVLRAICRNKSKKKFHYETMIAITMMVEILVASCASMSLVCANEGFPGYDFVGINKEAVEEYAIAAEGSEGHNTFERTELFPNNICDIQSIYDVKGLSIFSSTARESFIQYMRNFGFHNNGINGLRNNGLTLVTATTLGVRNLISVQDTTCVPLGFDEVYTDGDITVFDNPDALAVGYMVSDDIIDFIPDGSSSNVFENTNQWIRSMGISQDVYSALDLTAGTCSGATCTELENGNLRYSYTAEGANSSYTVTIDDAQIGSEVYIYANSNKGGTATVMVGDDKSRSTSFSIRSYQIISCGIYDGTPINVTVSYPASPAGSISVYGYQLNQAGYDEMLSTLSQSQFNVTSYDSDSLSGTIDVAQDGFMLFTVPYSEGFELTVDGQKTELVSVQDALCGVHLKAGHHEIKLVYTPPMFEEGLLITSTALLAFVILVVLTGLVRKFKAKKVAVAAQEGTPEETLAEQTALDVTAFNDELETAKEQIVATETTETTESIVSTETLPDKNNDNNADTSEAGDSEANKQ